MSNPFATFRKNQNYWMAGLVLLSILAFVVAPAIMQIQESLTGGSGGGAVVVRWNGGQLTVADMQNAVQKHGSLVRFLNDLAQEVVQAGGEPRVPGFFYDHESKQVQRLGIETNSDEESIAPEFCPTKPSGWALNSATMPSMSSFWPFVMAV
ncbi:MAG: hypothetical protein R3C56_24590 [Pirellulaceae bacterium]